MAILGLESVTYCVDDLDRSTDFFEDFGAIGQVWGGGLGVFGGAAHALGDGGLECLDYLAQVGVQGFGDRGWR